MFFLFTALYLLLAVTVSVLLLKLRRAPDRSGSDLESDPPEL
jgi:hypothetical protein